MELKNLNLDAFERKIVEYVNLHPEGVHIEHVISHMTRWIDTNSTSVFIRLLLTRNIIYLDMEMNLRLSKPKTDKDSTEVEGQVNWNHATQVGRANYEMYCRSLAMPSSWNDLPHREREAWIHSGMASISTYNELKLKSS